MDYWYMEVRVSFFQLISVNVLAVLSMDDKFTVYHLGVSVAEPLDAALPVNFVGFR